MKPSKSSTCLLLYKLYSISTRFETVEEIDGNTLGILYLITANWVVAFGLQLEYHLLRYLFGALTTEEWDHYLSVLESLLVDLYSLLELTLMYGDDTDDGFDRCAFYVLVFVMQSFILEKCHTLMLNLHVMGNFEKVKSIEQNSASLLLLLNCFLGALSLKSFLENGILMSLFYTLRFSMLASDLVYFKVWSWNTFEEFRSLLSPEYDEKSFRHRENIFKTVWCGFKLLVHMYTFWTNSWRIASVKYLSVGIKRACEISMAPPQSLLGYGISTAGDLSVVGVEQGSITEQNNECIVCFEDIHYNGEVESFGPQDPVRLFCGHLFHYRCLMEWFKVQKICPTCRQSALDESTFRRRRGFHRLAFTQVNDEELKLLIAKEVMAIYVESEGSTGPDYSDTDTN